MKKNVPYDGVTGFMTHEEVTTVMEAIPNDYPRKIMVGVLASSKTLNGEQNKWPQRYPLIDDISNIFPYDPGRVLGLVHFSTDSPDTLYVGMLAITIKCLGNAGFNGFQLNVKRPDPRILEKWRKNDMSEYQTIVLQIGRGALEEVKNSPTELALRLVNDYQGLIDYALLDPSGGLGKPFDPEITLNYLRAINDAGCKIDLGIAGGLSSTSLKAVQSIAQEFPNISIDAEGKLRNPEGHLDCREAIAYLEAARKIFI